jgi:gamma-glutamyl:cysteine ligase YbdK (ATP-grasp superfamily)
MHKDTKRLFDALVENSDQLDKTIPETLRFMSPESRVLLELLHDRDLILRCLLSHVFVDRHDEDVPNASTSHYSKLQPTKKNDREKL